jgi:hypothetical protein
MPNTDPASPHPQDREIQDREFPDRLPVLRISGRDATAAQLLEAARPLIEARGGSVQPPAPTALERDYAQVDPSLDASPAQPGTPEEPTPRTGIGYAGMSPVWRFLFTAWAAMPALPAPSLFHDLYVASLECAMLEAAIQWRIEGNDEGRRRLSLLAHHAMRELAPEPAWAGRGAQLLSRATALGLLVGAEVEGWPEWWRGEARADSLREGAIGAQALLGVPMDVQLFVELALDWGIIGAAPAPALARLRLEALRDALEDDPLQWALAQSGEKGRAALPWRAAHRDLRLSLPQPTLRPFLEPRLAQALSLHVLQVDAVAAPGTPTAGAASPATASASAELEDDESPSMADGYSLVLEFGHSRSEFYEYAVETAQRARSYQAILDENRRIVHRVTFGGPRSRTFWRLWDYVGNWTTTRVYVNGVELEKWQIWPWSDYLQR